MKHLFINVKIVSTTGTVIIRIKEHYVFLFASFKVFFTL
jgi:hypothetical protein